MRALIIGIDYIGTEYQLNGCRNDAYAVKKYLESEHRHGLDLRILTEDEDVKPTYSQVRRAIKWLMKHDGPKFFYYSGHGTQRADYSGDEDDGLDEGICCLDHNMWDDHLYKLMVKPLKGRLFCIFDCCHSDTMLDMPRLKGPLSSTISSCLCCGNNEDCREIVCISGCKDNQSSYEVRAERKNRGLMTYNLIKAINKEPTISYARLIEGINRKIKKRGYPQHVEIDMHPDLDLSKRFKITG